MLEVALIYQILQDFIGVSIRISPVYLLMNVPVAYAAFRIRQADGSFLAWLLPKHIIFHPSHVTDIKLYIVGRSLAAVGLLGTLSLTTLVAATVVVSIGRGTAETAWHPVLIAVFIAVINDFGVYWVHRLHHRIPVIWPFHAVHHSAEVLTPVTVYRKHPVYDLFSRMFRGVLLGLLQGLFLAFFVGAVEVAVIAGTNVVYVLFNLTGSNLRHSHLWLRYGTVLEHVLISPAQHQIHHSRANRHKDKNYGEIFAFWDWLFGTLYVPSNRETLDFGLSDKNGVAIVQPHDSLAQALLVPFRDSWRALWS